MQKKLISILFPFLRATRHWHMRHLTSTKRWRRCWGSTERRGSGAEVVHRYSAAVHAWRRVVWMVWRWRRRLCMVWPRRLCRPLGRRGGTPSWRPPTHTCTRRVGLLESWIAHLLRLIAHWWRLILEARFSGKPTSPSDSLIVTVSVD